MSNDEIEKKMANSTHAIFFKKIGGRLFIEGIDGQPDRLATKEEEQYLSQALKLTDCTAIDAKSFHDLRKRPLMRHRLLTQLNQKKSEGHIMAKVCSNTSCHAGLNFNKQFPEGIT
jgi:hypothetical protein